MGAHSDPRARRVRATARRGGRWLARGFTALVVLALLGVAAAYVWLRSADGRAWLLREVLAGVNGGIAGRLEARSLTIGGLRFTVHELTARTPGGEVVATAERVGPIPLWPLVQRRLVLDGSRLVGADIRAHVGERENELVAAFRPAGEAGKKAIQFRDIDLVGGSIHVTQDRWSGPAESVKLDLDGGWVGRSESDGPLVIVMTGSSSTPLSGRFRGELRLGRILGAPARWISIEAPGAVADVVLTQAAAGPEVQVERLSLQPEAGRALWPAYPIPLPLELEGIFRQEESNLALTLQGKIGEHAVRADAEAFAEDDGRLRVEKLEGELAGTEVVASGAVGGGRPPEGEAALNFQSVERLANAVAALTGVALGVAGTGQATLTLDGAERLLRVDSTFERLARGPASARELSVAATIELDTLAGKAEARATRLVVGSAAATKAHVTAERRGEEVSASMRAKTGGRDVAGSAAGTLLQEQRGIRLAQLRLRSGGERWSLAAPSATVKLQDGGVAMSGLALRSGPRRISLAGFVSGDRVAATAHARAFPLSGLGAVLGVPLEGSLSGRLSARGPTRAPALTLQLNLADGSIGDAEGLRGSLSARARRGGPVSGTVALRGEDGASASGDFRFSLEGLTVDRDAPLAADLRVASRVETLAAASGRELPVFGEFSGRFDVGGTLSDARVVGELSSRCLRTRLQPSVCIAATVRATPDGIELGGRTSGAGVRARLSGETPVGLGRAIGLAMRGEAGTIPFSARVDADRFPVSALPDVSSPQCSAGPGRQAVRGTIALDATAWGTLARPEAQLRARLEGLGADGGPVIGGIATAHYRPDEKRIDLRLRSSDGSLAATASLELDGESIGQASLSGRVALDSFDPAPLAPVLPPLEELGGRMDGKLAISGTWARPNVEGEVAWNGGRLWTSGFGRYDDLELRLAAQGRDFTLEGSAAHGNGAIRVDARGEAGESGAGRIRGAVVLDEFPVLWTGRVWARTNAKLPFRGTYTDDELRLEVDLGADVHLPYHAGSAVQSMARSEGVVLVCDGVPIAGEPVEPEEKVVPEESQQTGTPRGAARRRSQAGAFLGRSVRLVLATPKPVHVSGEGLDLQLVVSRGFSLVWTDRLLVFGSLRAPSGTFEVMGTDFALLSGSEIRFEGPPEAPFVELGASGTLGKGDVALFAHGQKGELQLGIGGNQRTSELAIYSLLATGRAELGEDAPRPLAHGRTEGAGWGSALARYLATQFPLDALLARGTPASSYEATAEIGGSIELGALSRLGGDPSLGENWRANQLAVRLAPEVQLRGRFGDGRNGGIDVLWVQEREPRARSVEQRAARTPRGQRR